MSAARWSGSNPGGSSVSGIELLDQTLWADVAVGVTQDGVDFFPIGVNVEAKAYPASMADIFWNEETLRFAVDQLGLHTSRRRAPHGQAVVIVMAVPDAAQRLLVLDEECRRAVTESLGHFGVGSTKGTQLFESCLPFRA